MSCWAVDKRGTKIQWLEKCFNPLFLDFPRSKKNSFALRNYSLVPKTPSLSLLALKCCFQQPIRFTFSSLLFQEAFEYFLEKMGIDLACQQGSEICLAVQCFSTALSAFLSQRGLKNSPSCKPAWDCWSQHKIILQQLFSFLGCVFCGAAVVLTLNKVLLNT